MWIDGYTKTRLWSGWIRLGKRRRGNELNFLWTWLWNRNLLHVIREIINPPTAFKFLCLLCLGEQTNSCLYTRGTLWFVDGRIGTHHRNVCCIGVGWDSNVKSIAIWCLRFTLRGNYRTSFGLKNSNLVWSCLALALPRFFRWFPWGRQKNRVRRCRKMSPWKDRTSLLNSCPVRVVPFFQYTLSSFPSI